MIVQELISDIIPYVKPSDSIQKVSNRMDEFRVSHLPVVEKQQFLGLVSDDDLIEVIDYNLPIKRISLSLHNPFVYLNQHVYDVMRLVYEQKLSLVPVLDDKNNYMGLITAQTLIESMATLMAAKEPGGIIILEINNRDNSLPQIAQIVESENAQILSSYLRSYPDSTKLELTLKVNKQDISSIIASFLRYNYVVLATYNDIKTNNGIYNRYDQLMNYLDI